MKVRRKEKEEKQKGVESESPLLPTLCFPVSRPITPITIQYIVLENLTNISIIC